MSPWMPLVAVAPYYASFQLMWWQLHLHWRHSSRSPSVTVIEVAHINRRPASPGVNPNWSSNTNMANDAPRVTNAPRVSNRNANHYLEATKFSMEELLSSMYFWNSSAKWSTFPFSQWHLYWWTSKASSLAGRRQTIDNAVVQLYTVRGLWHWWLPCTGRLQSLQPDQLWARNWQW